MVLALPMPPLRWLASTLVPLPTECTPAGTFSEDLALWAGWLEAEECAACLHSSVHWFEEQCTAAVAIWAIATAAAGCLETIKVSELFCHSSVGCM